MPDASNNPPDENESSGEEASRPERWLVVWFLIALSASVLSMLWLSVREDSPAYIRTILDFCLHAATGSVCAYFAFRALFLYPFQMLDLFTIVIVLSLEMKLAIDEINSLAAMGIIQRRLDSDYYHVDAAGYIGVCLLTGSVAVGGAALGLRHCHELKIKGAAARALTVLAGMLALPAAAGTAGFLALGIVAFGSGEAGTAAVMMLLWFLSMAITGLNVAYFLRTVTLKAEIGAAEKMP